MTKTQLRIVSVGPARVLTKDGIPGPFMELNVRPSWTQEG
jgi:hypothetical protein